MIKDSRLRYNKIGFLEVVDKPSPEMLQAYYAERYYQTERGNYQKTYSEKETAYLNLKIAQKASVVDRFSKNKVPRSFLDVGCGEGFALAWFSTNNWSVEGIDYSIAGLETMNPAMLPYVESGDLFEILDRRISEGKRHDLVWLNNVLEHVPDPVALLKSLQHLVAPDGMLVVTVPNDGSIYQEFLLENGNISDRFWIAIPDHLSYFTYDSLLQITEACGWKCNEIIAEFPIDFFLLHPGSNYILDRAQGSFAHQARIQLDLMIGDHYSHDKINEFYGALARIGLGRDLTAFISPSH
jgi:2-polyprenyl-3-methyl-5-hydroxy-6-metoxy-1,4-benzoquinol methylase